MQQSSNTNPTARDLARAQFDPAQVVGHLGDTFWSHLSHTICPRTRQRFPNTRDFVLFIEKEFTIASYNSWLISDEGVQAIATLKALKAQEDILEQERLEQVQQQQRTQSVLEASLPVLAVHGNTLHQELTRQPATSGVTPCYQVNGGPGVKMSNNARWQEAFPADMDSFLERHPQVAIQFLDTAKFVTIALPPDAQPDSPPLVINSSNHRQIIGLNTQIEYDGGYHIHKTGHRVLIKNYGTVWVLVPLPS